ncbi:uncharacterized protein M421DRAFT_269811 [Didymella exigua CBS 183.55]|uniref:Uncharacterized protein n=1 Tax=Didymella exigua CBS 183.55 TaxID=1150837 RepID=A0A6A5REJ6_9PLEO|nr:uncharacterized protein M421DRAFT_269811 [Didymella exigua CBS 183.55]KAF1924946.1 hypothetical protein M421DRAFT_269811 [Didymella exigua CBS 183.55]
MTNMHQCCHEQDDDSYASGAENHRQNLDRLNRDVAFYDHIKQIIRGSYGPSFGGHICMPGHAYGLGHNGYAHGPPYNPYGGHYGHPGFSGSRGKKSFYPPQYDNDSDSGDESPSPWYPSSPPPTYATGPLYTSGRPRRSQCGGRYGRGPRNPWADAFEHDYYRYPPMPHYLCAGHKY